MPPWKWDGSLESQTHSRGNEGSGGLWGRADPPWHNVCLPRASFDPPVYWRPPWGHFLLPRVPPLRPPIERIVKTYDGVFLWSWEEELKNHLWQQIVVTDNTFLCYVKHFLLSVYGQPSHICSNIILHIHLTFPIPGASYTWFSCYYIPNRYVDILYSVCQWELLDFSLIPFK